MSSQRFIILMIYVTLAKQNTRLPEDDANALKHVEQLRYIKYC